MQRKKGGGREKEKRGYLQSLKIVTFIKKVISGSQTSLHSQDFLTLDRESREGKDDRGSETFLYYIDLVRILSIKWKISSSFFNLKISLILFIFL